jgi:hypothetical protein
MRPHFKENGISISERLSALGKTVAFLFVTDDPPKLRRHAVQHRALFLHALGVIVDHAGDAGHNLLLLLARGVIQALRNPSIVKAEIASQRRGVRRKS